MGLARLSRTVSVLAIVGLLAFATLVTFAPRVSAGAAVVFSEDFESGVLLPQWNATDTDIASGLDYWGVSGARNHTGLYSAWAAQVGNQSSGPNAGQNNSAVGEYDDNMQADLTIDLRVNGYTSLTLSFYYYSKTESGGGDWIQAWYEAGGVQTIIFTNVGSTGNKWDPVNISVPNDLDRLIFRFHTDTANHGFEGAYVDDIVLTGIENVPPTSTVMPLPPYSNVTPVAIAFTAQDNPNASGVDYVELYYRQGTTGNFSLYTPAGNSLGRWATSPIPFDPPAGLGDGYYEFYTIAVDRARNAESSPASAQANTTIDRVAPVLTLNAPASGEWFTTGTVLVAWQATDALSGLDHYETRLNGGAYASNGVAGSKQFTGLFDGQYQVSVKAIDRAGNAAILTVGFGVDTIAPTLGVATPTINEIVNEGAYTFTWTGVDDGSGIDHYQVSLDGGAPADMTSERWSLSAIADGTHTFHIVAYDRAGNTRSMNVTFVVDTNPFSLTGPYRGLPLFLLLAIVIALLILFLFFWKRRKDKEKERKALEKAREASPPPQAPYETGEESPPPGPP